MQGHCERNSIDDFFRVRVAQGLLRAHPLESGALALCLGPQYKKVEQIGLWTGEVR
jgi:hypothetical protein